MTATSDAFKDIVPPLCAPTSPSLAQYFTMFAPAGILISFFRQCVAAADASLLPLSRFPLAATCSAFAGIITTSRHMVS